METAELVGVSGVSCPGIEFDRLVVEGERLVFVVTEDLRLVVALQVYNGFEIRHPVLAEGRPVLAAGEIELLHAPKTKLVTDLTNQSGHYEPHASCLEVAIEVLVNLGYKVPRQVIRPYPRD